MTWHNDDISYIALLARVFADSDTIDIMTNKKRIILGIYLPSEMEILDSSRKETMLYNEKSCSKSATLTVEYE